MARTAVELAEAYAIAGPALGAVVLDFSMSPVDPAVQREISRSLFGTARRPRRR